MTSIGENETLHRAGNLGRDEKKLTQVRFRPGPLLEEYGLASIQLDALLSR